MPASCERFIENFAGRPDKRMALNILLIARLLADEHHARLRAAFAKNGLRACLPESQAWQSVAADRSLGIVGFAGMSGAAVG